MLILFSKYKILCKIHTTQILVKTVQSKCVGVQKHIFILLNEQIDKRGISFSGSQYGSCSTTYNTLPVTKVVYN